ncbi:hypothetical protein [Bacillus cabrialesii]|uniref:hypothetical protein n=1 Tax=Bacillus cabrialesii TaxID=2487276 RepID=UPI003305B06A
MKNDASILKRSIIVHQINQDYIRAFCFRSRQTKTLTIENILAVSPAVLKEGSGIMRKTTERQYETLRVIEKYINEKGFAPT